MSFTSLGVLLLGVAAAQFVEDRGGGHVALGEQHEQVVQEVGRLAREGRAAFRESMRPRRPWPP